MANKLSWNPPKWKSYTLNESEFKVELETGEVYTGTVGGDFINMSPNHPSNCYEIFGQHFSFGNSNELKELSEVLDLDLKSGYWPEFHDVHEFLTRYYNRVAKTEKSFTQFTISIESEFNVTPKFTI